MNAILHISSDTTGGGEVYFRHFFETRTDFVLIEIFNANNSLRMEYPEKYISLTSKFTKFNIPIAFLKFVLKINELKPKAINPQDYISLVFTLLYSLIPRVNKPRIYFYTKHDPKNKKYLLFDIIQQTYFNKCKAIFCISNSTKKSLEKYHKGNFVTIHNGIKIPIYIKEINPKKNILFIGRIVNKKGLHTLIDAFNKLETKDYKLYVCGKPYDLNLVNQMKKKNNIVYLGEVSEERKYILYSEASVVVVPSLHEGFGYSALEALFTRNNSKTLIVSDISVFKEILGDLPTYFSVGNSSDLKDKINNVINNESPLNLNFDKKLLYEKFSSEKMVKAYLEYYQ